MNMAASEQQPRSRPGLVGPVILIGLGVIFLLNNFGIINWNIWNTLWRFWPVLLIVAGLDLLIGRRSTLVSLLLALLLVVALGFGVWYLNAQSPAAMGNLVIQPVEYPAEGVTRASIEIRQQIGELRIAAMSEPDGLIRGTIALRDGERLTREYSVSNGVAYLALHEEGPLRPQVNEPSFDNRRWDLRLNPDLPLSLNISAGVGQTTLDLRRLQVTALDVGTGVGDVIVTLPAQGVVRATIGGGAGNTTVRIPAGVAARIETSRGLGDLNVAGRFERQSDQLYVSPDYESNPARVDLKVSGGVGSIRIESVVVP